MEGKRELKVKVGKFVVSDKSCFFVHSQLTSLGSMLALLCSYQNTPVEPTLFPAQIQNTPATMRVAIPAQTSTSYRLTSRKLCAEPGLVPCWAATGSGLSHPKSNRVSSSPVQERQVLKVQEARSRIRELLRLERCPGCEQGQTLKLDQVFNAKVHVSFLFLFHCYVGEKYLANAFICQRERQSLTKPLFFPFPKLPLGFVLKCHKHNLK